MKNLVITALLLCMPIMVNAEDVKDNVQPKPNINVIFKVLENDYTPKNKSFSGQFIITNNGETIDDWKLCFNLIHPFTISKAGSSLVKASNYNHDDYHEVVGAKPLKNGSRVVIGIDGSGYCIEKYSDCPGGYFIVDGDSPVLVSAESDLSAVTLPKDITENNTNKEISKKTNDINIIPVPVKAELKNGQLNFSTVNSIVNTTGNSDYLDTANIFLDAFKDLIPQKIPVVNGEHGSEPNIYILKDKKLKKDSFKLKITTKCISLYINDIGGLLYGLGAIIQLNKNYDSNIPAIEIEDSPRFAYRGMLFDPSRNFISVDLMKRYIRLMAFYRLNVLHMHLTDSEGWRIQIDQYPNLVDIGAYRGYSQIIRPSRNSGPYKYGGYYSKNDIKELIDYANSLNITVLPEVDTPGHSTALIQSFSNYKSKGKNPLVDPGDTSWMAEAVLNPAVNYTYTVLDNVFKEIVAMLAEQQSRKMPFSDCVGIGGDEVSSTAWDNSPKCKALMAKQGLSGTTQVQSYFMNKVAESIKNKFKFNVFVWQEALKGGDMDKDSTLVYSWVEADTGLEAAENGYHVIMTPQLNLYFDHAYNGSIREPGFYGTGYVDAKMVYSYNPVPDELSDEAKKNIKGTQGCLWGDELEFNRKVDRDEYPKNYLANPIDYMGFPKMTALSELAWSPQSNRNWDSFTERMESNMKMLNTMGVKYRK